MCVRGCGWDSDSVKSPGGEVVTRLTHWVEIYEHPKKIVPKALGAQDGEKEKSGRQEGPSWPGPQAGQGSVEGVPVPIASMGSSQGPSRLCPLPTSWCLRVLPSRKEKGLLDNPFLPNFGFKMMSFWNIGEIW